MWLVWPRKWILNCLGFGQWLWYWTIESSLVLGCGLGNKQRGHHLRAWEKIETIRSHSRPAFWQDIPGDFCVHQRWLLSDRPRSLPFIILWFNMEENRQSFGKEWQESGLRSERTGLDEVPDGVVVSGGEACEAARVKTAKSLQGFRCQHPGGKLRIYHRTCLACSDQESELWSESSWMHFSGWGQLKRPTFPLSPNSESFQLLGK